MDALTLYLLRHAKSSWADDDLDDHDRPLAPRGERAATLMGVYLAQRACAPALVLCSSARRAVETLERVVAQLPREPEVRVERALYLAGPQELLRNIQAVGDWISPLMLVGHHPGLAELAGELAGRGDASARRRMAGKFATAGLAELGFELEGWKHTAPGHGELRTFCTPKDIV